MGNVIGNLTQGELWQVVGRLFIKIGEKVDAGEYSDGVSAGEIFDLGQGLIADLLKEYTDENEPPAE